MAIDLKQAQRRLIEETFGNGNFGVLEEICEAGFTSHDVLTGDLNLQQTRDNIQRYRTAFPDLKVQILGQFVDGTTTIMHWRMSGTHQGKLIDVEPTGNRCTTEGMTISRFRGAKLVEDWTQWDALGLMRQLEVTSFSAAQPERPRTTQPRW